MPPKFNLKKESEGLMFLYFCIQYSYSSTYFMKLVFSIRIRSIFLPVFYPSLYIMKNAQTPPAKAWCVKCLEA